MTTWRASDGCIDTPSMGRKRKRSCPHGLLFVSEKAQPKERSPLRPVSEKRQRQIDAGERPRKRQRGRAAKGAPRWLTQGFADGVDERAVVEALGERQAFDCWLAQFDPEQRPCSFKLERFHFISRQRVAAGVLAYFPDEYMVDLPGTPLDWYLASFPKADLTAIAEWDPRNGGVGCEEHHRRLDSHLTPRLVVPREALPEHVANFVADWGLETEMERKFPATVEAVAK